MLRRLPWARALLLLSTASLLRCAEPSDGDFASESPGDALEMGIKAAAQGPLFGAKVPDDGLPKWWLGINKAGYLTYRTQKQTGDRLPDFSHVGYRGGTVSLPALPVLTTLQPAGGGKNDTPAIQRAIAALAKRPVDAQGRRGAILLRRGNWHLGGVVHLNVAGVVLRGEGQDERGTVLKSYIRPKSGGINAIVMGVGGAPKVAAQKLPIVDAYVPIGASTLHVAKGSGLQVGDDVRVTMSANQAFISTLGMDRIPPRKDKGRVLQWKPAADFVSFQRRLTGVSDDGKLSLDVPLPQAIAAKYGGGYVAKYTFAERISEVGIENLRGVSDFDPRPKDKKGRLIDENHANNFISIVGVENGWVRDVTAEHFVSSLVYVGHTGKRITVANCTSKAPVSQLTGGRRYAFNLSGELVLMRDNRSEEGRHDFVLGARTAGPNVFLNSVAVNSFSESGPHQRWATGLLMDNVSTSHVMGSYNAKNRGSGHGWTGAQMVFWNCAARRLRAASPPTARNWALGGKFDDTVISCHKWRVGNTIYPKSLYQAQLADRKARQGA